MVSLTRVYSSIPTEALRRGTTEKQPDFTLPEGNLRMPDTYLSSIHKKYQLVRVGNRRHRVDGKTKKCKNEVNIPLANVSITGTPEQGLGSRLVPGKSRLAAQPNTGEIYSLPALPAWPPEA